MEKTKNSQLLFLGICTSHLLVDYAPLPVSNAQRQCCGNFVIILLLFVGALCYCALNANEKRNRPADDDIFSSFDSVVGVNVVVVAFLHCTIHHTRTHTDPRNDYLFCYSVSLV